jgi:hypothetical protein
VHVPERGSPSRARRFRTGRQGEDGDALGKVYAMQNVASWYVGGILLSELCCLYIVSRFSFVRGWGRQNPETAPAGVETCVHL